MVLEAINILESVANNFALEIYDLFVTVRYSDYETIGVYEWITLSYNNKCFSVSVSLYFYDAITQ